MITGKRNLRKKDKIWRLHQTTYVLLYEKPTDIEDILIQKIYWVILPWQFALPFGDVHLTHV